MNTGAAYRSRRTHDSAHPPGEMRRNELCWANVPAAVTTSSAT